MAKIRGRDTGPELELRRKLSAAGVRYRLHASGLPGRPDVSNRRAQVAVFVDGCFWHGCPEHIRYPKTRAKYWRSKIGRNVARRAEVKAAYPRSWKVIEVFECQLRENPRLAGRIAQSFRR